MRNCFLDIMIDSKAENFLLQTDVCDCQSQRTAKQNNC